MRNSGLHLSVLVCFLFFTAIGCLRKKPGIGWLKNANQPFEQSFDTRNLRMGFLATDDMVVTAVKPASFAHVTGLKVGDRVEKLNGVQLKNLANFERVSNEIATANPVPWILTVRRGKNLVDVTHKPEFTECEPFSMIHCGSIPDDGVIQ